ncbi:MAG: sulfite exporter TauE/SafE family protein [Deltaproteobacteria bacterium]|nr:sulfite exporter TauE/SafE family protein [Deltaproteobacteria bacterium]
MAVELLFIGVLFISFCAEYIDSSIGMGYGTTLTPILLLMGFSPLQIVPAILLSEFISGILAAFLHQGAGNVFFDFRRDDEHRIAKALGNLGYMPRSKDSKVALVLVMCSVTGVIAAVFVALNLPVFYLKLYIGILVLTMGIIVMMKHKTKINFSWKRIMGIGILASFNKGMSGGGYGPLIVSGQILSGVDTKSSIGITALAEGATCFVGVLTYFVIGTHVDWVLAPYLVIGSLISVPLSVYTVKKMPVKEFTLIIGLAATVLGILTLVKLII